MLRRLCALIVLAGVFGTTQLWRLNSAVLKSSILPIRRSKMRKAPSSSMSMRLRPRSARRC